MSFSVSSSCYAPNSGFVRLTGAVTNAQRAVRVRVRLPLLAPFPAPHPGATGGLAPERDAAGRDPDPGLSLGPRPDPDHQPRGIAVGSGEMFTSKLMFQVFLVDFFFFFLLTGNKLLSKLFIPTAAESPGGSGESMRSGFRNLKP